MTNTMIFRVEKRGALLKDPWPVVLGSWESVCIVSVGDLSEGVLRGMLRDRSTARVEFRAVPVPVVDGLTALGELLDKGDGK